MESHGQSLIDLSLYVSSLNFYETTSPSYAAILAWPNQWIIPPKVRTAAKNRTQHLGLSSLDLLAIEEERDREHSAAVAAGRIPKSLLLRQPRDTVSSLLGRTSQQNRFKLDALTAELFGILESFVAKKIETKGEKEEDDDEKEETYLLASNGATSLDCLALGYLSLALFPDVPYPWLREALQSKAPRLAQYTEQMRHRCFGSSPSTVSEALLATPTPTSTLLPWKPPQRTSLTTIGTTLWTTLADATPILKDIRASNRLRQAARAPDSGLSGVESQAVSEYARSKKTDLYVSVASVGLGVVALVGYMVHVGLLPAVVGGDQNQYEDNDEEGGEISIEPLNASDILSI